VTPSVLRMPRLSDSMSEATIVGWLKRLGEPFVRGEPLVCSPKDAFRCFMATQMDVLVLDRCVLLKSEQAGVATKRDPYWTQFKPD